MKNRKQEIIYAALELASVNGPGTVSMQQIADKAGITKASLYNHFSGRDEIVEAMYEYLRSRSAEKARLGDTDYDRLTDGRSLREILSGAVNNYRSIVSDPGMYQFYRIIMMERPIRKAAAQIMVRETETMISATKTLFYALQVKGIADFIDPDAAAFSFAMGVHAVIDYEFDLQNAGKEEKKNMMDEYIREFSRLYEVKGKKNNGEV